VCHVLIIEDEPLVALSIQDVLEQHGATSFSIAATEHDAVRLALAEPPALITSDVHLREGRGPLAVAAIHDQLGPIPVVYVTGSPAQCEPRSARVDIIEKPFSSEALARAVDGMREGEDGRRW
jgi:CheY-like chemotaxis protein